MIGIDIGSNSVIVGHLDQPRGNIEILINDMGQSRLPACDDQIEQMVEFFNGVKQMTGQDVLSRAVIAVPHDMPEDKKEMRKNAAVQAGFDVQCLVSASIAAAVGAGLHQRDVEQTALIFDCGYSGVKASVIQTDNGSCEVKASLFKPELGGGAIDTLIYNYFIKQFREQNEGVDLAQNEHAQERMMREVQRVKVDLSTQHTTKVTLLALADGRDFEFDITKDTLKELIEEIVSQLSSTVYEVLEQQEGMEREQLTCVILTGGSSFIPSIQECFTEEFEDSVEIILLDGSEGIARGATILAGLWADKESEARAVQRIVEQSFWQGLKRKVQDKCAIF